MKMQRFAGWTLAVLVALVALGWWLSRAARPDAFYDAPDAIPAEPGVLLRQEPYLQYVPGNARGWKILYTTTRSDGSPALDSAIVLAPKTPATEPRPVLVWTHGTSGIVAGCGPSILDLDPARYLPVWSMAPTQGWIFVAPDYPGLGTDGHHEYLVGAGEARSALDAVRAARRIDGLRASDRTVVWGHSQGGHASLWTGIVAPTYAPDVPLAGVGAIAPATDLPAIIVDIHRSVTGRILTSYVLQAYADTYPDVGFDDYVRPVAAPIARDMASRCATPAAALFSALEALSIGGSIFRVPPTSGALGVRLAQNIPDGRLAMPLMIAQGTTDDVIAEPIQAEFVRRRCAAGQSMTYARYAGRDHMGVAAPGSPLDQDLLRWTRDRFDGVPAAAGCEVIER